MYNGFGSHLDEFYFCIPFSLFYRGWFLGLMLECGLGKMSVEEFFDQSGFLLFGTGGPVLYGAIVVWWMSVPI